MNLKRNKKSIVDLDDERWEPLFEEIRKIGIKLFKLVKHLVKVYSN